MKFFKIIILILSLLLIAPQNIFAADNLLSEDDNKIINNEIGAKIEKVKFNNLEEVIIENIKLNIVSDDFYGLKNVSLNKKDSLKKFSLLQAKTSNIQDEYLLADFTIDEVKRTFKATLKHSEKNLIIEVNGKFEAQIEVPVTVSNISKGSIITEDDIKLKQVDKARKWRC
jgi:flagella basal body P-ring formation protein FlgA